MTYIRKKIAFIMTGFMVLSSFAFQNVRAEDTPNDDTFVSLMRQATPLSDTPANVTIITQQQIKDSGARTLDELLPQTVAADVSRSGSVGTFSTIRLRGVPAAADVKIVIDDQPYGGFAADQNIDISQIPLDNVEKIEIVRGGSSVLYGANTTGGVIHIFTKKRPAGKFEANAGLEKGSLDTTVTRGDVGVESNGAYASANFRNLTTDGFQQNSDANDNNHGATLGYIFPNSARVGVQYSNVDSETGVPQGTSVPISDWDGHKEQAAANPTKRSAHQRDEGRATVDVPLTESWRTQTLFFGSDDNFSIDQSIDPFETPYAQTAHVLGAESRLLSEYGFTAGISYERDESRNSLYSQKAVTMAGGYLQQEFKTARLSLIPALRFDNNTNFGNVWNPRLTAIFHAAPTWTVSSNIARSYRAPSFFDQYYDSNPGAVHPYMSNRNVRPETSWTYDLGNEWKPRSNFDMKAVGFYTTIRDRIVGIDTNGDGFDDTNGNASKAELVGVEFEEKATWGRFTKWENYTYQRSRGYDANKPGSTIYSDIPYAPQHKFNIGLDITGPSQTYLSNVVQYVAKQYNAAARTDVELPSYAVWNMRLAKKFKAGEIFASVNNILNRRYAESTDFNPLSPFNETLNPMPDRNCMVGVSLHFLQE